MYCKVCKSAHSTYKCPALQNLVKQIEDKTIERRKNIFKFIVDNGLNSGRLFETKSFAHPTEIFGDAIKFTVFWEPEKFDVVEYCNSKFIWTNYKNHADHSQFHLAPTVYPNNFKIRAVPKKMFWVVDKAKLSGIMKRWVSSGDPTAFGFFPFGINLKEKEKHSFLYWVTMKNMPEEHYDIYDLPQYVDFDLDLWNFAGLEDDDFDRYRKELNLYYGLVTNSNIDRAYKFYGLNKEAVMNHSYPVNKYCAMEFVTCETKSHLEGDIKWSKKDILKATNKVVKFFY